MQGSSIPCVVKIWKTNLNGVSKDLRSGNRKSWELFARMPGICIPGKWLHMFMRLFLKPIPMLFLVPTIPVMVHQYQYPGKRGKPHLEILMLTSNSPMDFSEVSLMRMNSGINTNILLKSSFLSFSTASSGILKSFLSAWACRMKKLQCRCWRFPADLISESGKRAVIIASSDFTHYETAERAKEIDSEVIDSILNFDISGMYDRLYRRNASVCGYGPITAMLTASKKLGGSRATLLKYANSGDVSGDKDAVVGYAAIIVE
ncbi:hypothetical protein MmTuc01_1838 [Methanosarcina mazei Tuc01]|uniref:AmmeMemoRadiSam system protein B n=1 Tax=Methanosarcina mazei Tuc01 TaxID=1236903 RepID=M1PXZ4_METMZ|nr:hypothetical protein MmTuc01_1838 [Methanosarcina mazei Tuc01]